MKLAARFALEMAEAKNVLRHVAVAWNNAMKFARTGALQRLWAKTVSECVAAKLLTTLTLSLVTLLLNLQAFAMRHVRRCALELVEEKHASRLVDAPLI
jgi:hypothetical protein